MATSARINPFNVYSATHVDVDKQLNVCPHEAWLERLDECNITMQTSLHSCELLLWQPLRSYTMVVRRHGAHNGYSSWVSVSARRALTVCDCVQWVVTCVKGGIIFIQASVQKRIRERLSQGHDKVDNILHTRTQAIYMQSGNECCCYCMIGSTLDG